MFDPDQSSSDFQTLYIASIIDSISKLYPHDTEEAKVYWRQIEKLISRNEFFSKLSEIGMIALILQKYSNGPYATRQLDLEEAFEKAEI